MRKLAYIFGIALFFFGCATYPPTSSTTLTTGQTNKYLRVGQLQPGEWYKDVPKNIAVFISGNPVLARIAGGKFAEYLKKVGFKVVDGSLFTKGGLTDKSFYKPAFKNAGIEGILTLESDGVTGLIIATYVKIKLTTIEDNKEIIQIQGNDPRAICSDCSLQTSVLHSTDTAINFFKNIINNLEIVDKPVVPINLPGQGTRFAESPPSSVPQPVAPPPQPPAKQTPQAGSGSGFFVSKIGHVITNAHVVQSCNKVTIGDSANKQVPAEVVNTDKSNDLALLKLSTLEMASAESKSLIQKLGIVVVPLASKGLLRSEDVRLGEKILVAGYPFGDAFSNSIKVTTGVVSSIRGVGDDSGQFQLDAAVQPGNSGGPIYDSSGNIVGVVISQLNKRTFGSLVENVNFGVKASTVRQFLVSSGLSSKKSEQTEEKSTEQLAEIAQNQALMVMCLQ